jgi:hypothetical protein
MNQIEGLDYWIRTTTDEARGLDYSMAKGRTQPRPMFDDTTISIIERGTIVPDEDFLTYLKSLKTEMKLKPEQFRASYRTKYMDRQERYIAKLHSGDL